MEQRAFPAGGDPLRVLITGGASCPDGLIQQVISRLNTFFPADRLRPIDDVLASLQPPGIAAS
jgi:4-hydroxy-3-methylbut-2-enyl diphosphate reductase